MTPGGPGRANDPDFLVGRIASTVADLYVMKRAREVLEDKLAEDVDFDPLYLDRDGLRDLPTPEPLIDGVIHRHCYGILRGRDGTYKSFVALDWALCLATGKPWQGRPVNRVRVLYVAGEGAYGLAARVEAWEQAWGTPVDPAYFHVRSAALNMYRPGPAFVDLLARVSEGAYGLVIVDTLRRVSGSADGNGSEMGAVVDNLDRLKGATADGSVLVISHTDKGDNDSRGYSGIEDDADIVWHAKRDEDALTLRNTKMKDGPDGAVFDLAARPELGSLVIVAGAPAGSASTTQSQLRILDTLRYTFRDGAHNGQLLEASGLPKTTYYRALSELKDAGHVVNTAAKSRPFYILPPDADSHEVPPPQTGSDLGVSHESHSVPPVPDTVPPSPAALKGGSGTRAPGETPPEADHMAAPAMPATQGAEVKS